MSNKGINQISNKINQSQRRTRPGQIVVKFEFLTLKKVLKMVMNNRSSIKSLKPLFALKLDYQFAHMDLKLTLRKDGKKYFIEIDKPLNQIYAFKNEQEAIVQIEIIYEGG